MTHRDWHQLLGAALVGAALALFYLWLSTRPE